MSNLATISVRCGYDVAQRHNRRDPAIVSAEHHIDPNGPHETWVDIDEREAYDLLFSEAQAAYNANQRRKDRQIKSYYASIREPFDAIRKEQQEAKKWNDVHREEIKRGELEAMSIPEIPRSMKKPSYELIIGVYHKEQRLRDDGTPELDTDGNPVYDTVPIPEEQAKSILKQYVKGWQARNPHLFCIGIYYHFDEQGGAPHLHIDFVPVADGYTRGMERQNGLDRALQQQGFASEGMTSTAIERWTQAERDLLEEIATIYGFDVIHPQTGKNVKHKTKEALRRDELDRDNELLRQKIAEKEKQVTELDERITHLRSVSAQAAGIAYEEAKRRDEAKAEADRMIKIANQEAARSQAIREQINQNIIDYVQALDELQAGYEADGNMREKRAIQAVRYSKMKDGQPVIDYFANYYEYNTSIPRIPEDEVSAKIRRGISLPLLDTEAENKEIEKSLL